MEARNPEAPGEQVERKEIPPEFLEALEKDKHLKASNKVELLLLYADKPASVLVFNPKENVAAGEGDPLKEKTPTNEVISLLEKSGLPFKTEGVQMGYFKPGEETPSGMVDLMKILVGSTEENLKRLERISDDFKDVVEEIRIKQGKFPSKEEKEERMKAYHQELGLTLGYPPTAVEAYVNKETLTYSDLPPEAKEGDAALFGPAYFSKDHWREELEQGQKHADFIKSVAPGVYNEFIEAQKIIKALQETSENKPKI